MRAIVVIGLLVLLALSMGSVKASPAQVFYLHKWTFENPFEYLMDENQPTQYSYPLDLSYVSYYFRTGVLSSDISIDVSTWTISLWLGYTVMSTSLRVAIGYLSAGSFQVMAQGNITGIRQFPNEYSLNLFTSTFQVPAGGALALQLTPVKNTLIPDPNVVLYMDSAATPSHVSVEPSTPIPEFWIDMPIYVATVLMSILISSHVAKRRLPILTF